MERFLMAYVLNSIWQAPLLAASTWLALRAVRPSPLAQHRAWVATLTLTLAMPLFAVRAGTSPATIPSLIPPTTNAAASISTDLPAAPPISQVDIPSLPASAPAPHPASTQPALPRTHDLTLGSSTTHWLIGLYLAITAFLAIRLLTSWWLAMRIIARATPARLSAPAAALLHQCCERLGVSSPSVLISARAASPLLVGVLRPSLLLPEDFAAQLNRPDASPDRDLEAVWLHELVHLRRRDYLANFACRIAALPIAYHPATFAVQQRIRQTREMVCDEIAATEMESPVSYARCLVSLARNMHGMTAQIEGIGILDDGTLEERIMQLINLKSQTTQLQVTRLAAAAAMLLTVLAASTMFHLTPALAQTAPSATPQVTIAPISPTTPIVASQPSPQTQPATNRANPASPATPAAAKDVAVSPDLEQQVQDAKKQLGEASRTYQNLLRQQVAIDGQAATVDSAAGNSALNQQLADAQKQLSESAEQLSSLMSQRNQALINNRLQIASAAEANLTLNNAQLNQQLQSVAARFNSPEFKEKMERLQQLAQAKFDSPEFTAQMEQLNALSSQKQLAEAQAKINPEFKARMEQLGKLAAERANDAAHTAMTLRTGVLDDQFNQQMDEVRREIDEAMKAWDALESARPAPKQ